MIEATLPSGPLQALGLLGIALRICCIMLLVIHPTTVPNFNQLSSRPFWFRLDSLDSLDVLVADLVCTTDHCKENLCS
jgi:hypothetical protein